ncbi:MAG: hypothetical protein ACLFTR_00095 [Candidatus Woesearchaeota archaeon]
MAKELPVFIKVEDYKDVIDVMELIKNKILEANGVLEKIRKLKAEEDAELELWDSNLEDIERKISYIDKTLFEPEDI